MISYIKNKISRFRKKLYHFKDTDSYYGEFIGSLNFWKLLLWNLLYFEKLIFQIRNRQVKMLNHFVVKKKLKKIKDSKLRERVNFLNNNGYLILDNYFSQNQIDKILGDNNEIISKLKSEKKTYSRYNRYRGVPLNENLVNIWLDSYLITLMQTYLNTKIYSRMYPTLNYTTCVENTSSKKTHQSMNLEVASYWHVDYTTTMSVTIFLSDVGLNDTRMQVVPGTNLNLNSFFKISDETVENKKIKIADCIGKKGSVLIHCGNIVHRMKGIKDSNRLGIHYMFSPGSNIALDVKHIASSLSNNYDLDTLSENNREIIKGLFPQKVRQGYNIKGKNIIHNNFKGL